MLLMVCSADLLTAASGTSAYSYYTLVTAYRSSSTVYARCHCWFALLLTAITVTPAYRYYLLAYLLPVTVIYSDCLYLAGP